METVWTQDLIDNLGRLWAEGHSTAEIGRRLGLTKNAVVGKAHRLSLAPRPSPLKGPPKRRIVFPFLRRPPARWQALLRRARGHGLYPAEEVERRLTARASPPALLFRPTRRKGAG